MKNKAFTLIELLAVIIILGILMLIAIPSVTNYINNSKKATYITTINQLIKGVEMNVTTGKLKLTEKDTAYYIPCTCVDAENGEIKSPYGKFDPAYVVVTFDGKKYNYYFTGKDVQNMGVPTLTKADILSNQSIVANIETIDTTVGIDGKEYVVKFNEDCSERGEKNPANVSSGGNSSGGGTSSGGESNEPTCKKQTCPKYTPVIYWSLTDKDSDGSYDKLIISAHEVEGDLKGSFAGDTVFREWNDIPWDRSNSMANGGSDNLSYNASEVVVEGEVAPKSTAYWFFDFGYNSKNLSMDLDGLKMCHVTNARGMFEFTGFRSTNWSLGDLCSWDISNLITMADMFKDSGMLAETWTVGDINNWNTSKVTNMSGTFSSIGRKSKHLYLDVSDWDTSNVTDISWMFFNYGQRVPDVTLDVSRWNVSKVTNMSYTFDATAQFTENFDLDLSNWDVSNVTNMKSIFSTAGQLSKSFNLNISTWNMSNVTNINEMFNEYTGQYSNTWNVTIPATNGHGLSNTETSIFGSTESIFANAPEGREFTIAD